MHADRPTNNKTRHSSNFRKVDRKSLSAACLFIARANSSASVLIKTYLQSNDKTCQSAAARWFNSRGSVSLRPHVCIQQGFRLIGLVNDRAALRQDQPTDRYWPVRVTHQTDWYFTWTLKIKVSMWSKTSFQIHEYMHSLSRMFCFIFWCILQHFKGFKGILWNIINLFINVFATFFNTSHYK